MELRQLEAFLAVAEESSFTRAAARMHVVQSAISATIANLERELGTPLLRRTSRSVRLTEAGRAFVAPARATLDAARAARDAVDATTDTVTGVLRLGTMSSLAGLDLPTLLGTFHRRHPAVEIRTVTSPGGSPGLVTALKAGALDAAFVSHSAEPLSGLRLVPAASTVLRLAVPEHHRLAPRASVSLGDLLEDRFVDFPEGYGNRVVTDLAFTGAGIERQVAIEITDVEAAMHYVKQDLGIALVPDSSTSQPGVRVLPVTDCDLTWQVFLALPDGKHSTAAARALAGLVAEAG
ncbi:LysR family transcriptional regulator [Streptomyces jietaisiensis]|uniref:LysR family transcriptional regulator n=1 Tax=Streptomyces griseoaurantiacus TaxID=68213 RepID=UPI003255931F